MAKKAKVSECDIRIVYAVDENPDLSFYGEYSQKPGKFHIDRKERGDMERNQYQYFNSGEGDAEYLEQNYERMEAYNAGNWHMMGVWAEANIEMKGVTQRIRSGGIWGVESDSGKENINELAQEQLNELYDILTDDIGVQCKKVKAEDLPVKEE